MSRLEIDKIVLKLCTPVQDARIWVCHRTQPLDRMGSKGHRWFVGIPAFVGRSMNAMTCVNPA